MITHDNIKEVIDLVSSKDKHRIAHTNKEYIVLELCCTNNRSWVDVICSNNFIKYQYISKKGGCILESNDIIFDNII